ncbi:hypothetical protein MMP74_14775 [Acinetobacter sp. NIPH 1869]|uniref:hypothetical protein n=1 Tax=Acinetobacter higginsii TaxID=70347 RepID=UPI001F4A25BA|nr:hypothetical protein [Acinetobacter higginsii]MCH7305625.1 hypothetical protein [Acinetobacter higginsii]
MQLLRGIPPSQCDDAANSIHFPSISQWGWDIEVNGKLYSITDSTLTNFIFGQFRGELEAGDDGFMDIRNLSNKKYRIKFIPQPGVDESRFIAPNDKTFRVHEDGSLSFCLAPKELTCDATRIEISLPQDVKDVPKATYHLTLQIEEAGLTTLKTARFKIDPYAYNKFPYQDVFQYLLLDTDLSDSTPSNTGGNYSNIYSALRVYSDSNKLYLAGCDKKYDPHTVKRPLDVLIVKTPSKDMIGSVDSPAVDLFEYFKTPSGLDPVSVHSCGTAFTGRLDFLLI